MTVKYRVTALYRDVIYSFDCTYKDKKVPNRFFGIRDLPHLKAGIGILKLSLYRSEIRDLKDVQDAGYQK